MAKLCRKLKWLVFFLGHGVHIHNQSFNLTSFQFSSFIPLIVGINQHSVSSALKITENNDYNNITYKIITYLYTTSTQ